MPVPQHIFDPPFNIIRCSHVVLDVVDLNASREFYENTVGLHVEDRDDKAVYLRGSEEHQHHSVVLRKSAMAACNRMGFRVGNEQDLDKAAAFFSENVRHLPTPFGGMKSSGIGRDGGDYSFDFYMETKHVSLARGTHKIQRLGI